MDKNTNTNSQIILQGRFIDISYHALPQIKSNSYHSKSTPVPVVVNERPKSVEEIRKTISTPPIGIPPQNKLVEEIQNKILTPPSGSPPYNKSFIKRMYHRVISSNTLYIENPDDEDAKYINDEIKMDLDIDNISMKNESNIISSNISSLRISKETDTTNSRVGLLMNLAQSTRDLSLNTDILPEITSHNNGDHIIPPYYMNEKNMKGKLLDIDFGWTIIDSIRNLRPLTTHQLEFLKTLSDEKLLEIIHEYDHIMRTYIPSLILDGSDT